MLKQKQNISIKVAMLFMASLSFISCGEDEKEGEPAPPTVEISVTTQETSEWTEKTIVANGFVMGLPEDNQSAKYGVCYSSSNHLPTILNDSKVEATEIERGNYTVTLTGLTGGTMYYYRAFVEYGGERYYGITKKKKTRPVDDGNDVPTSGQTVDLGLSIKWAGWNVGASKPEEYGGLYGWGDPTGNAQWQCWDPMDASYKEKSLCYSYYGGINPPSSICGTQYDIAHVKWGDEWRMPTDKELQELINVCNWKIITYKGTVGRLIIGPNGNKIFLPSAGRRDGTTIHKRDEQGRYWSGILEPEKNINVESLKGLLAYMASFEKNNMIPTSKVNAKGAYRYVGASVRPVKQ